MYLRKRLQVGLEASLPPGGGNMGGGLLVDLLGKVRFNRFVRFYGKEVVVVLVLILTSGSGSSSTSGSRFLDSSSTSFHVAFCATTFTS